MRIVTAQLTGDTLKLWFPDNRNHPKPDLATKIAFENIENLFPECLDKLLSGDKIKTYTEI